MINKNKFIIFLLVLMLLLTATACTSEGLATEENGVVLKFNDSISTSELRKLDGQQVQITGFIGGASPLDGAFIYLMNMPYEACAFCVPNTENLGNTIAVYPTSGQTIPFQITPITVSGTLVFSPITDKTGYSYEYSIQDAVVSNADIEGLEKEVQIYTTIVDRGLVTKYDALMGLIYERTVDAKNNTSVDLDSLLPIGEESIADMRSLLDGLNPSDYTDIIALIDKLEETVNLINISIENKDSDGLSQAYDKAYEAAIMINTWLKKPQI